MHEIKIQLTDMDREQFDSVWNELVNVLHKNIYATDWNIEELDR